MLGMVALAVGLFLLRIRKRFVGRLLVVLSIVYFWIIAMPITAYLLGHGIERHYTKVPPKDMPECDVAVCFGGYYARAWYAAELVKAGKAKVLIASGRGMSKSDAPLISDLGVGEDRLIIEDEARNTEENVKFSKKVAEARGLEGKSGRLKVLVVSTSVHMPRCMLSMQKYWPEAEAVAAPSDFPAAIIMSSGFNWSMLLPSIQSVIDFEAYYHEYVGWVYYRYFRR